MARRRVTTLPPVDPSLNYAIELPRFEDERRPSDSWRLLTQLATPTARPPRR